MTNESACASPWSRIGAARLAVTGVAVTGVAVTGVAPGVRAAQADRRVRGGLASGRLLRGDFDRRISI